MRHLSLIATFLLGALCGTFHGAALYFFDTFQTPVLDVVNGDVAWLGYARVMIDFSPGLLVILIVARGYADSRKQTAQAMASQRHTYHAALVGWVLALAPFFYIFRALP